MTGRATSVLAGVALWIVSCVVGPVQTHAYDVIEYRLDFTGQRAAREIVTSLYQGLLTDLASDSAAPAVRIGIGASNPVWDDVIIAYFDHPRTCDESGCKLVLLYRDNQDDGQWIEYFDGKSNGGWIVYFASGFTWCIEMNGGIQKLEAGDDGFIVEVKNTC